MKKIFGASRTGLVEIVVSTVFFIIICLFTVNVFIKTEEMRRAAMELSEAVIQAESVAERLISESPESVFCDADKTESGGITIYSEYYDAYWNKTSTPDYYLITTSASDKNSANGMITDYTITVYKMRIMESANEIYSITTSRFWYGE